MSTNAEKLVKFAPELPRYLVGYDDFCRLVQKGAVVTLAISAVRPITAPIIVTHDVAKVLPLNIFESVLPYSYPFRNASLPNEGHIASFVQICCHDNVP